MVAFVDKDRFVENFGKALEWWIDDSIKAMVKIQDVHGGKDACSEASERDPVVEFACEYIKVLNAAKKQIDKVQKKISELIDSIENIDRKNLISKYVEAMTITYDDEDIFLPSFSDNILKKLLSDKKTISSPFRGLYVGWKLGEIYYKWNKKRKAPKKELRNLFADVTQFEDISAQDKYKMYLKTICEKGDLFDKHISLVKESLKQVVFERKWFWEKVFPYPPLTSTHFYLSGIRYYLYPALYKSSTLEKMEAESERFYVNSTDSGLFKPTEHYGTLIENMDDIDEIKELIELLPPGSLMLDIVRFNGGKLEWEVKPTARDRENLWYFEIYSEKIIRFSKKVLSKTLEKIDDSEEEGFRYFKSQISKNPLRKFYFDTGIFQAALISKRYNLYPKISYLTTAKSKVSRDKFSVSWKILEPYIDNGVEYHYLDSLGWENDFRPLAILTLFPTEGLSKFTSYLVSERESEVKKITHGKSFHARYAYLYARYQGLIGKRKAIEFIDVPIAVLSFLSEYGVLQVLQLGLYFLEKQISWLGSKLGLKGLNTEVLELLPQSRISSTKISTKGDARNLLTI